MIEYNTYIQNHPSILEIQPTFLGTIIDALPGYYLLLSGIQLGDNNLPPFYSSKYGDQISLPPGASANIEIYWERYLAGSLTVHDIRDRIDKRNGEVTNACSFVMYDWKFGGKDQRRKRILKWYEQPLTLLDMTILGNSRPMCQISRFRVEDPNFLLPIKIINR